MGSTKFIKPFRVKFKDIHHYDDAIHGTVLKIEHNNARYFIHFDDGYKGWFNAYLFVRTFK